MAFELLVGRSPFAARNDDKIEDKIHTGARLLLLAIATPAAAAPPRPARFVEKSRDWSFPVRPPAGSYAVPASAPMTDHARTFLNACLRQDPAGRLSCRQLLGHPWALGSLSALTGCACLMGCQKARRTPQPAHDAALHALTHLQLSYSDRPLWPQSASVTATDLLLLLLRFFSSRRPAIPHRLGRRATAVEPLWTT